MFDIKKILITFVLLSIHFVFNTNNINAGGFDKSYSLRGGLVAINEIGFFIYKMDIGINITRKYRKKLYGRKWRNENKDYQKTYREKDGYREKRNLYINKWRKKNPLYLKEWKKNNKERFKKYRKEHKEESKEWRKKHPEYLKEWRKVNKKNWRKHHNEYCNKYAKERKKKDFKYKLNKNISSAVYLSLKGNKKNRHWETLVDYTLRQLKNHLEKQFDDKMSWGNYGSYWVVDHKIPISKFNFTLPEHTDFLRCWKLSNLRPLEKIQNIQKGDKLFKPFQPTLAI